MTSDTTRFVLAPGALFARALRLSHFAPPIFNGPVAARRRTFAIVFFALGLSFFLPHGVRAESLVIPAAADSYIFEGQTSRNFGHETQIVLKNDEANRRRGYVRFDLSLISTAAVVVSARLDMVLTQNDIPGSNDSVFVYGINNGTTREQFVEGNGGTDGSPAGELTWNNAPFRNSFPQGTGPNTVRMMGEVNVVPTTPVGSTFSYGGYRMVDFLNDSIGADDVASFVMTTFNFTPTISIYLASREYAPEGGAAGDWAPKLVVDFVPAASLTTLIPEGDVWRYYVGPTKPAQDWNQPEYIDESWQSGLAQLGYGDGDEETVIACNAENQCDEGNWSTTYFRRTFTIDDPSSFKSILGRITRDDAAVVYLNGVETFRDFNFGSDDPLGAYAEGSGRENGELGFSIDPSLVVEGENVLAVEIRQVEPTSSDVSFNFQLVGYAVPEPSGMLLLLSGIAVVVARRRVHDACRRAPMAACCMAIACIALPQTANAESIVLPAIADTYVEQHNPSTNYGNRTELTVKNDATSKRRPYIKFDLSAIPAGSVVISANLGMRLSDNDSQDDGDSLLVFGVNNGTIREDFVEGDGGSDGLPTGELTWANAPFTTSFPEGVGPNTVRAIGAANFNVANPVGTKFVFGGLRLIDFLNDSIGADNLASFVMSSRSAVSTHSFRLAARDYAPAGGAAGDWTPQLEIEYVAAASLTTLVSDERTWRYYAGTNNPGSNWNQPAFSDAAWLSGPSPLGYGEGDEATVTPCGPSANCTSNNWGSTYFRHSFTVDDPPLFKSVLAEMVRDDAAAVFLNGVEVFRDFNFGSSNAFNSYTTGVGYENGIIGFSIAPSLLVDGENVLAIEVRQDSATSSDVSFDFQLVGYAVPEPSGLALCQCGMLAFGAVVRRRRRSICAPRRNA